MNVNNTSKAVDVLLSVLRTRPMDGPSEEELKAICEKFKRMEEALQKNLELIQSTWVPSSGGCYFYDGKGDCPMDKNYKTTQDSLSFDPLA